MQSGILFQFISFGESHGQGIGGVVSGMPAGVKIDTEFLQGEVARRQGGGKFATPRKEDDAVEILSGVFDGLSSGTPIGFFVRNMNVKSKDYSAIKDVFRPSHADFTYHHKYGVRDYRGGGRSSARESVARVFAGGLAKLLLREFGIAIFSGINGVGSVVSPLNEFSFSDFLRARESEIFALDSNLESSMKEQILNAKKSGDSVGASAFLCVKNAPLGLGEPLNYKLDSILARDLMGLNAVKAVEIGDGIESARRRGSENNDFMRSFTDSKKANFNDKKLGKGEFLSNHSGGILGGISNGNDIIIKVHFKPTPSIFQAQDTIDIHGNNVRVKLQGRHDPCVGVRGSVVCESIVAMVLADMLLLNATSKLDSLKKIYK
ncbi:chorismate synthase [Helicobacter saguini]|uniref:Chorismate synthase n=1 Tax=Helicobacter saguini TaxID=1548018 RepID=A0A347VPJ0_9HELI|nr:chorismate synthase [Helicobacter saguini]MWV61336.1 chorismate synthase [Helicobacter saguini]MWV67994.1 chorismate synthase [Helicobacter saguini]MWV70538.1 chorismate synthase [Helicobacter saguini]MWV72442.1 chorismate synthase [Helicobacter saguini]TLD94798.1 chorismate synthase [Helicobacter saguini]